MYFDIHSHILPDVDDGAKDLDTAVKLLEMSKDSEISSIVATPHFYPSEDNLENFFYSVRNAYNELSKKTENLNLPKVYLGCEILYFIGLGAAEDLSNLTLNRSKYILIELTDYDFNKYLYKDLIKLKKRGYIPVIAHVERYRKAKGFKKFLKFIKSNRIPVQINTSSVLMPKYLSFIKQLFRNEVFLVLATDTHSVKNRPPLMKEALTEIQRLFGDRYRDVLIMNSKKLYKNIIGEDIE